MGLSPAESPVACTQITGRQTEGWHGCDQNMRWSAGDDFSSPAYRGEDGGKSQQLQAPPSLQGRTTQGRHGLIPVLFRCCSCFKQSHNHHGQVHRSGSQGATGLMGPSQKSSPSTSLGYFETQPAERGTRVEVGNRPWSRVRGFRQLRGCQSAAESGSTAERSGGVYVTKDNWMQKVRSLKKKKRVLEKERWF